MPIGPNPIHPINDNISPKSFVTHATMNVVSTEMIRIPEKLVISPHNPFDRFLKIIIINV